MSRDVKPEGSSIEFPIAALPHVDEHAVEIEAPQEAVFSALITVIRRTMGRRASRSVASALGCTEIHVKGDPDRIGSTVPGFVVARVVEPAVYALEGEHRFSRYGLVFCLDALKDDRTRLRAETRAEFPGLKGKLYRSMVIGTRGHVFATNSILKAVKRRAEKQAPKS